MLQKILSDFSLNSLKKLAGTESLKFFEETLNISSDYYESNNQSTLLTLAILNSNPITLFFNKKTRDFFIDRMNKEDISLVFEKINGEAKSSISPKHYDAIKTYCNNKQNLTSFLKTIGLQHSSPSQKLSNNEFAAFKSIKPQYGLYPYQVQISEKVFKSIELGNNNRAVIHLPTGAGKTRTAMHIICRHLMTKTDALMPT